MFIFVQLDRSLWLMQQHKNVFYCSRGQVSQHLVWKTTLKFAVNREPKMKMAVEVPSATIWGALWPFHLSPRDSDTLSKEEDSA
jgi:hypothetical protein